jgi:uncharacterized membrane protein
MAFDLSCRVNTAFWIEIAQHTFGLIGLITGLGINIAVKMPYWSVYEVIGRVAGG